MAKAGKIRGNGAFEILVVAQFAVAALRERRASFLGGHRPPLQFSN